MGLKKYPLEFKITFHYIDGIDTLGIDVKNEYRFTYKSTGQEEKTNSFKFLKNERFVFSSVMAAAKLKLEKDSKGGFVKKQIVVSLVEASKGLPQWTKSFEVLDYFKEDQDNSVRESAKITLPGTRTSANLHYVCLLHFFVGLFTKQTFENLKTVYTCPIGVSKGGFNFASKAPPLQLPDNFPKEDLSLEATTSATTTKIESSKSSTENDWKKKYMDLESDYDRVSEERDEIEEDLKQLKMEKENLNTKLTNLETELKLAKAASLQLDENNLELDLGEERISQEEYDKIKEENSKLKKEIDILKQQQQPSKADDSLQQEKQKWAEEKIKLEGIIVSKEKELKQQFHQKEQEIMLLKLKNTSLEAAAASTASATASQKDLDQLQIKIQSLETQNNEAMVKLKEKELLNESSKREVSKLTEQLQTKNLEVASLKSQLERKTADFDALVNAAKSPTPNDDFNKYLESQKNNEHMENMYKEQISTLQNTIRDLESRIRINEQAMKFIQDGRVTDGNEKAKLKEELMKYKTEKTFLEQQNSKLKTELSQKNMGPSIADKLLQEKVDKLQAELEEQKKLNCELEQKLAQQQQQQQKNTSSPNTSPVFDGASTSHTLVRSESSSSLNSILSEERMKNLTSKALTSESIILDPIGSVRKSVLALFEFFKERINADNSANGVPNIEVMGVAKRYDNSTKGLLKIVNSYLIESLSQVFKADFAPSMWSALFGSKEVHFWAALEDISENPRDRSSISEQFSTALKEVSKIMTPFIYLNYSSLPYSESEMLFRAFVIYTLNKQNTYVLFKWILSHSQILKKYYGTEALVLQDSCAKKLVQALIFLAKLKFDITLHLFSVQAAMEKIEEEPGTK